MLSQKERDGALFLIGRYRTLLQLQNYKPVRSDSRKGFNHIHWMLVELQGQILSHNEKYDDGKVGRWIGYIQYFLADNRWIDPEDEADLSRPFFSRPQTNIYSGIAHSAKAVDE